MTDLNWKVSNRDCGDGACVEVAEDGDTMLVRDNKDPQSPILNFREDQWNNFLETVRSGGLRFGVDTGGSNG